MKKAIKTSKYIKYAVIIFIIIFVLASAFYCGLTVTTYDIQSDIIDAGSSVCIVVVADLHNSIFGRDQQPLIQKIKRQNPDIILLAGDITDDVVTTDRAKLLLSGICGTAPVYYVEGNHEGYEKDIQDIYDEIESLGATVITDKYEQIEINGNQIIIAGAGDPYNSEKYINPYYFEKDHMDKNFAGLDKSDGVYKILLAHRPEFIDIYSKYPFDLIVSGHTHGGQVRIPFILNGLYAPNQGWFPKYAGGLYEYEGFSHIISRGLSVGHPKVPRIFNPPELVVINITS